MDVPVSFLVGGIHDCVFSMELSNPLYLSMLMIGNLISKTLPLNRKELFYTGTIFPMIVCREDFAHFNRFLELAGLEHIKTPKEGWNTSNILFFTEYSLKESLVTANDAGRFQGLPNTKDTPDMLIYLDKPSPALIALEAKMFDTPGANALTNQMNRQKEVLNVMADELGADMHHFALIPQKLYEHYGSAFTKSVITWEQVRDAYRDFGGDYFHQILCYGLESYPELVSRPKGHCERMLTGSEIVAHHEARSGTVRSVGRGGGSTGRLFTNDLRTGNWKTRLYETSSQKVHTANWFSVEEFVEKVLENIDL